MSSGRRGVMPPSPCRAGVPGRGRLAGTTGIECQSPAVRRHSDGFIPFAALRRGSIAIARRLTELLRVEHRHGRRHLPRAGWRYRDWLGRGFRSCRRRISGSDDLAGGRGAGRLDLIYWSRIGGAAIAAAAVLAREKGPCRRWFAVAPTAFRFAVVERNIDQPIEKPCD